MKSSSYFNNPILFYDSQCKFCSKTKSIISRIDSKNIKFNPLTPERINQFRNELHISRILAENVMYYKNKHGEVSFGSEAFFEYLRDKKGVIHILGLTSTFPPLKWFSAKLYSCIALNRYIISKFLR